MEEELKQKIAAAATRIGGQYKELLALLATLSPANAALQQYLQYLDSTIRFTETHFQQAASIDLAACKLRRDPARLLMEVQSRFNAQEQGFYALYPDPVVQFKAQLNACFSAAQSDIKILDDCIAFIPG